MAPKRTTAIAMAAVVLFVLSCEEFDSPTNINDLRILAVKTEPAEIKLPVLYTLLPPEQRVGLPLPQWQVEVEVYAFDPRQGKVTTSVFMCPDNPDDPACLKFESQPLVEGSGEGQQAELAAVYQSRRRNNTLGDPDTNPAVPIGNNSFTYRFTSAVIDSLLWQDGKEPEISLTPLFPRFVVELENSEVQEITHERAYKRIPLSTDFQDPTLPPEFLQGVLAFADIEPCSTPPLDDSFIQGPADCFYDRGANNNPVLTGFDLVDPYAEAEARDAGETIPAVRFSLDPELGPEPVLLVEPGGTLHIRPVFAPETMERYQVFVLDPVSQKFSVENRYEDFVCHWYVTGGEIDGMTTSTSEDGDEFGPDAREPDADGRIPLDMDWIVASGAAAEGRDTLVVVVNDQRGGVAIGQIIVEYQQ